MDVETATATARTPVSCTIQIRDHTMVQDKPAAYGGDDEGPMASEILLASLLSCQLSTFAKIKAKRGADVEAVSVRGDCHFDDAGDIGKLVVHWTLQGDDKACATLVRLTDKVCTISRALQVPIEASFETA